MNKKAVVFFLLVTAVFTACKKTSSDSSKPTTYQLTGVKDETIKANSPGDWLIYDVVYKGPVQENVSLSLQGLPDGLTIDSNNTYSIMSGIPGFEARIHLIRTGSAGTTGTYPIKLLCTGAVTGLKEYDFNLMLEQQSPGSSGNPAANLVGIWFPCRRLQATWDYKDSLYAGRKDTIFLNNFGDLSKGYALFYLDGTLEVPLQNIPDKVNPAACCTDVYGTGVYSSSLIEFKVYLKVYGVANDSMTIRMQR